MKISTAVTIAPRGKVFAVVRMNHVVGDKVLPVIVKSGMLTRAEADSVASAVDARLSPTVILIDAVRVERTS
jgi:GMP synthase PP-ATPase subunit